MKILTGGSGTTRLNTLRDREKELRAAIAAEQIRLARRKQKENARLYSIVGEAVVGSGERDPEGFGLMLRQVLASSVTDERSIAFLRMKKMI
jgi:hypothetical protein